MNKPETDHSTDERTTVTKSTVDKPQEEFIAPKPNEAGPREAESESRTPPADEPGGSGR